MAMFSARSLKRIQAGCVAVPLLAISGPVRAGSETVLYSFKGSPDGAVPYAGLTDVGGALYGTT